VLVAAFGGLTPLAASLVPATRFSAGEAAIDAASTTQISRRANPLLCTNSAMILSN